MRDDVPLADAPGRLTARLAKAVRRAEPGEAAAPSAAAPRADAWDTGAHWDAFYALIFVATVVVVRSTSAPGGHLIPLVALAAMVPLYIFLGRPLMMSELGMYPGRSLAYLVTLLALFTVADGLTPNAWFLAVALCPMCYSVATARRALAAIVVLSCVGAASVGYWSHGQAGAVATAICLAVFTIGFSAFFGDYVYRIAEQSEKRGSLITELESTRAELAELSRSAGALEERQRLAGDIHDTLAQGFSSILMLIRAAQAQLELSPGTARGQLRLAEQTARDNLAEARTLVSGLPPAVLQSGTLEEALRRITERAAAELGIDASFGIEGCGRPLPAATEVVLLRTGQEALANVRKHACAGRVTVRLSYAGNAIRLQVTDDGAGFDPAAVNGGYGLSGMRARVDEAGGTVAVRSAPAAGTSVLIEVPA